MRLSLRRRYIAHDADEAGDLATMALTERAVAAEVEAIPLSPRLDDFNEDLRVLRINQFREAVRVQLVPQDVERFMPSELSRGAERGADANVAIVDVSRPGADVL